MSKIYSFDEKSNCYNFPITKDEVICLKDIIDQFYLNNGNVDSDKLSSFHSLKNKINLIVSLFD